MKIIELEIMENTPENAKKLEYGDGYDVLYFDHENGEKRLMIGIWSIDGWHFPARRFRPAPGMVKNDNANYIIGWSRVKDWRENCNG